VVVLLLVLLLVVLLLVLVLLRAPWRGRCPQPGIPLLRAEGSHSRGSRARGCCCRRWR
jgi:hypothetical protein